MIVHPSTHVEEVERPPLDLPTPDEYADQPTVRWSRGLIQPIPAGTHPDDLPF